MTGCCGAALVALPAAAAPTAISIRSQQNSVLGPILVTGNGRTLYHTSAEPKRTIKCTGTCSTDWPPLVVTAGTKPLAGPGVRASLLGTVRRPDGRLQVTYAGMPLYLYAGDTKAGSIEGQGIGGHGWLGGIWTAVAPSGAAVKAAGAPSSASVPPGTPSSSTVPGMSCYA